MLKWYSLLDSVSDTNTNLEDAVCYDPTDTSYVKKNSHDEIVGGDCIMFDDVDENSDEETSTLMPDEAVHESITRKKLVVKPHQKRKVVRLRIRLVTTCRKFELKNLSLKLKLKRG